MATKLNLPDLYAMNHSRFEVTTHHEDFPQFEDVTICIHNCDTKKEAVARAKAFVAEIIAKAMEGGK